MKTVKVQICFGIFPEQAKDISPSHTPMVATAKKIKANNPQARVVFIGPCIAKKIEALDEEVDSK